MNIKQFFCDDTGAFSSQRLVFLSGFFIFLIMWVIQCFHEKKVSSIDSSVLYFLVLIMTSKVSQSIADNIKPPELKP